MSWVGGLAEWREGEVLYLSVAFTWKLDEAFSRAIFARSQGLRVVAGGPALFLAQMQHKLTDVAEIAKEYEDAIIRHNPLATMASRGCPVGCWFCIVPKMEGKEFTLLPEFPVRPILCDNNLSALPVDYQNWIISKYRAADVKLIDANSGFEPRSFTQDVYDRWKPLINEGGGPWRFAFDDCQERAEVHAVFKMLADEPQRRKRVYVLVGNEPYAECMERILETIAAGCEPHVQPVVALNSLDRKPLVRHDWTERKLKDVARWANGFVWRRCSFDEYDRTRSNRKMGDVYDAEQGLFTAEEIAS